MLKKIDLISKLIGCSQACRAEFPFEIKYSVNYGCSRCQPVFIILPPAEAWNLVNLESLTDFSLRNYRRA